MLFPSNVHLLCRHKFTVRTSNTHDGVLKMLENSSHLKSKHWDAPTEWGVWEVYTCDEFGGWSWHGVGAMYAHTTFLLKSDKITGYILRHMNNWSDNVPTLVLCGATRTLCREASLEFKLTKSDSTCFSGLLDSHFSRKESVPHITKRIQVIIR